jgi:hypothetical protein
MKKEIVIVGSLAAIALLLSKSTMKAGGDSGTIEIQVYDSQGNLVPHNSPRTLQEGGSYTVQLTVKNTSTRGGASTGATLGVGLHVLTTAYSLIPARVEQYSFIAGETRSFSYAFNVPLDSGTDGLISAWIEDPARNIVGQAQESITITSLSTVYGATIVIG